MSTPPKTDKFAAMAARQQQQQQQQPPEESETVPSTTPVKRDKLAAMAARQPADDETAITPPVVKRDKLAAMAARQQHETPPEVPRRDKFAAVAEQTAAQTAQSEQERNEADKLEKETKLKELKQKSAQRDAIWADLDQAEELVMQLLEVAEKTSQALATTSAPLHDLPQQYQTVLQNIHTLLQPHAEHIHAYQPPTAINRMYQTRVEWRLAVEAKDILEEYRALEGKERRGGLKRGVDDIRNEDPPTKRVKR